MKNTSDRLRIEKNKILKMWAHRVRELVPASQGARTAILLDHIPVLIDNLSIHLSEDQNQARLNKTDSSQANREHGEQRAHLPEYSLQEVFKEYEILRMIISEVVRESGEIPPQDYDKINQYLDQAISKAGCEFVAIRQAENEELAATLKRSNEDLERFAEIVAHDVRSPLATIFSFAALLDEDLACEKSPRTKKSLEVITSNAQGLMILVERLLEYSTIRSTQIEFKPVQLDQVISATITNLKSIIEETNTVVVAAGLPTVPGDFSLCVQLFQNLIANSIKFRKPNSRVKVKIEFLQESSSDWLLCVSDDGIGFDSDMREKIFEPFKRLHSKEKYSGNGLGLATCRRVVEMHGGKIWAESEPGIGSKFYFTFSKNPRS